MFTASQITILGFGVACYIVLYAVFLVYLLFGTSKDSRLVRRYEKRTDCRRKRLIWLAVFGGILAVVLVYAFVMFV